MTRPIGSRTLHAPEFHAVSERAWDAQVCDSSSAFWALRRAARAFAACDDWPDVAEYAIAFEGSASVRFELARPKPRRGPRNPSGDPADLYDGRIHLARSVPTRPRNWHDFFNALVWATFPRAKWALHERQYRAACRRRLRHGARSREEDALALLDEGGIVLLCAASHTTIARAALDERGDRDVTGLMQSGVALAVLFGHALYQNLARRGPPVRGMVALVACDVWPTDTQSFLAQADSGLAALLARPDTFAKPTGHGSLPLDPELVGPPRCP